MTANQAHGGQCGDGDARHLCQPCRRHRTTDSRPRQLFDLQGETLRANGKFPNSDVRPVDGSTEPRLLIPSADLMANGWDLSGSNPSPTHVPVPRIEPPVTRFCDGSAVSSDPSCDTVSPTETSASAWNPMPALARPVREPLANE